MRETSFDKCFIELSDIVKRRRFDLPKVLDALQREIEKSDRHSVERSNCLILLCELFGKTEHRKTLLEWIANLLSSVCRRHYIFSEIKIGFFVPIFTPPLLFTFELAEAYHELFALLKLCPIRSIIVATYCDLYSTPLEIKRSLIEDIKHLNASAQLQAIEIDPIVLEEEIRFWVL